MRHLAPRLCLLLWFLLCPPVALRAQEALQLTSQPASALERALGGVTPALIAHEIALSFASPALLGREHDSQLSLSYAHLPASSHLGNVYYGRAWGERGAWGIGLRFLSHGALQGFDRQGRSTGAFSATEALLQSAYSYELTDRLRAGMAFEGFYSAIEGYTSAGIGSSLGLNYYDPEKDLSLSLALLHLGRLFHGQGRGIDALPWDIQLGFSQRLSDAPFVLNLSLYDLHPKRPGTLTTDRKFLERALRHLTFGVSFLPSDRFWLALGYNPKVAQDVHLLRGYRLAGFSGGIGFEAPQYRISLAFSAQDPGVWIPQLTFTLDLGAASRL